jgi:hypothetical protein
LDHNASELTGNQLFEAALSLETQLMQRSGRSEMQRTQQEAEDIIPTNVEVQQKWSENDNADVKPFLVTNPRQRRRAVEFFEYHDAEENDAPQEDLLPSGRPPPAPAVKVDDGLVYSRVHGYRIKIDHHEDTSLAYKKVLGDIKVR